MGMQFFDDVFVEVFYGQQFVDWDVGDFFYGVEVFGYQDGGDFFIYFQFVYEQLMGNVLFCFGFGGYLVLGYYIELLIGQVVGKVYVLVVFVDCLGQVFFCYGQVY